MLVPRQRRAPYATAPSPANAYDADAHEDAEHECADEGDSDATSADDDECGHDRDHGLNVHEGDASD